MNCDRIARGYRWMEYSAFGRELERARFRYVDQVASARHALILGDGDGRFLASFAQRNTQATVDAIDLSGEMLRLTRARLKRQLAHMPERVQLHHADAHKFSLPSRHYDLIATHFFLDCFDTETCGQLIKSVAASAAPRATWLVSEFFHPSRGLARVRAAFWIWASYRFFRIATGLKTSALPDYAPALESNGFRRNLHSIASNGMVVSELWERA